MSDINRINGTFRSLEVVGENTNSLHFSQNGNYSLIGQNLDSYSYDRIENISVNESFYNSKTKNITISAEQGQVVIRNGKSTDTLLYNFNNPSYSVDDDSFFDETNTNEIKKPFSSTEEVNNLRNNSVLIESLGGEKSICLYSNNGINQISHRDLNLISDEDIILQSANKLNLTSMGYILLNSERLLGAIEEDINLISATGEFKVGGNGIDTIGIKVNSQTNKNYLSVGRFSEKADRNLHLDINENSFDSSNKNGILIDSKNLNNGNSFPDIQLNNYGKTLSTNDTIITKLNVGIGSDNLDSNNLIFVKKQNIGGLTYLVSLNNFNFTSTDINLKITYVNTDFGVDTIKSFSSNSQVLLNKTYTDAEVLLFNYQQAYINRDNHGHIKTKTNSNLNLGTNQNDIIQIKNTGNIGINTINPEATLELNNNYGNINNIRNDINKNYFGSKSVQMKNGNFIVFYNTFQNSLYNLEASIYNTNNNLISTFTVESNSYSYIEFDLDNLKGLDDKLVIIYCYFDNINYITQTQIYDSNGNNQNLSITINHTNLNQNCLPSVKSFDITIKASTGENFNGYLINYREEDSSGNINVYFNYYTNDSTSLLGTFNLINQTTSFLNSLYTDTQTIQNINIKNCKLNFNRTLKKFIIVFSGETTILNLSDITKVYYLTLIKTIFIQYDGSILKPKISDIDNNFFRVGTTIPSFSDTNYELLGTNILDLFLDNSYLLSYYVKLKDENKIKLIYREKYDLSTSTLSELNLIENLDQSLSSDVTLQVNIPSLSRHNTSDFVIGYNSGNKIKYYNSELNSTTTLYNSESSSDFTEVYRPFILRLINSSQEYLSSILFWNNNNTSNNYQFQSIDFTEILGDSSLLRVKNNNVDFRIKNSGDITIQDIMTIQKINNSSKFDNLLISSFSSTPSSSTSGLEGEIKFFENDLYIYLNSKWKKFSLSDI